MYNRHLIGNPSPEISEFAVPEYVFNPEECVKINPAVGIGVFAAECEKMTLTIMELKPNLVTDEHSHPHEQVGYMIEGDAVFIINGEPHSVRAGQMWCLPGGVPHQVKVGRQGIRVVEVFYPVREDFRGGQS